MVNYRSGVGRLVTDRYDFQNHVDGYSNNHTAGAISLSPSIVINGNTHTTVQGALTEIAPFATAVPDATASVKGIIKLSGDLSGSATNIIASASRIQNRTVVATAPTSGQVLTWNASGYWGPASPTNTFVAANDLSGTSSSQNVIGITGTAGTCNIKCAGMTFASTVVVPVISQASTSIADGKNLFLTSQSSTILAGGNLYLSSGSGNSPTSKHGHLYLQTGANSVTMLHIGEPNNSANYVLSLCGSASATDMPANTGNKVIYIKNAAAFPTASPANGTILYAYNGALYVKQSNGADVSINNNYNKLSQTVSIYDNDNNLTLGYFILRYATTSASTQTLLYNYTSYAEVSSILVELTATAQASNITDGYFYALKRIQSFKSVATGIGSNVMTFAGTPTDIYTGSLGSWTGPSISASNDEITFYSGYHATQSSTWTINIKITGAKIEI